jgi:RHS repeat-associated protein
MLCAEDRIDTAFFPYEPKSLDGMIHNDHLATPQKMTDNTGTVRWGADYKPFGKAAIVSSATITNNLRFPGQYYDEETGLHYNYFRDYNPTIGRYVERDPIGQRGGINLYRYVGNNPVKWVDPLGLAQVNIGTKGGQPLIYDTQTGQYTIGYPDSYVDPLTNAALDTLAATGDNIDKILNNQVTDALDTIPPGQSVGHPVADTILNILSLVKGYWNEIKKACQ